MLAKLEEIESRFDQIEQALQDPQVARDPSELKRLGKARSELVDIVEVTRRYRTILRGIEDAEELLADPEMRVLAQEELPDLKQRRAQIEEDLKVMLLPKDPNDSHSVIVEIRPAAGGDEAGIFAGDLFRLYSRYAERRKWKTEVVEMDSDGMNSYSKVVFTIDAVGAYSQLKFESGVHRVQRVPATESGGRTHTSTVTVAVMPEIEEVELEIRDDDLEVSTFCSSSAGGQHMQKNETAIRIIHRPTGTVVTCQDERSQAQNKLKAMAVLRAKLYQLEEDRKAKERGDMRRGLIGSGDRSEKIRTYNYNQNRITDHRIGKDVHNIPAYMDGDIQEMIDALIQDDQARKLSEVGQEPSLQR
ncbi:MAG: peptide chain release factor 1 [Chthonomonas sp.]|nr:peptide chain release factor 1 [Chthonomonas sp.]